MASTKIGTVADFPEEQATGIDVNGIQIAVFNIEGEFFAIQDNCMHKDLPLSDIGHPGHVDPEAGDTPLPLIEHGEVRGEIDEGELKVKCPWHYMEWDLDSGESQVFDYCLPTYEVSVDGEDVFIEL